MSLTRIALLVVVASSLAYAQVRSTSFPFSAAVYVQSAPNGAVRGPKGQIAVHATTGTIYQNTNGATAWTTLGTVGGLGDVTGVTAGAGLTGGGTSGALTVDLACGAGLSCAADSVAVNLSGASCSAGSFVSSVGATGTGVCTAEVGDVSSVGATANMGLTGGAASGAALLGLLSTCSDGQLLKSGASGTTWTCASDVGITNAAGNNVVMKSNGTNAVASTISDDGTTVSTTSSMTVGDASGDVFDVNGGLSKFGTSTDGETYLKAETIGFLFGANSPETGYINYYGYNGGTTQFRNLSIRDGKSADIMTITGSTKAIAMAGALTVADTLAAAATSVTTLTAADVITTKRHKDTGTSMGISGCGSGATITTGQHHITVTTGTAPGTCVITYGVTYTSTPSVVVSTESATKTYTYSRTTTTVTLATLQASTNYDLIIGDH